MVKQLHDKYSTTTISKPDSRTLHSPVARLISLHSFFVFEKICWQKRVRGVCVFLAKSSCVTAEMHYSSTIFELFFLIPFSFCCCLYLYDRPVRVSLDILKNSPRPNTQNEMIHRLHDCKLKQIKDDPLNQRSSFIIP